MRRVVRVCFLAITIVVACSLIQALSQGPARVPAVPGPWTGIPGVPRVRLHYSNTGMWGDVANWDPNYRSAAGMFLEYGVSESSGFYADGDCAVIWSPGDLDILRIYDEDDLPGGAAVLTVGDSGTLTSRAMILTDDPGTNRPMDAGVGDIYAEDDLVARGQIIALGNTAGRASVLPAGFGDGSICAAGDVVARNIVMTDDPATNRPMNAGSGDIYAEDDLVARGQIIALGNAAGRGVLPAGFGDGSIYAVGNIIAGGAMDVGGNMNVAGSLTVVGPKRFSMPHPTDPETCIVYAAPEGPEAGTYVRGTARLVNGEALIELPDHFAMVTHSEGLTVSLTAVGQWLELYVVEKSTSRIAVREREARSGEFDYLVQGVREGFEDYQVLEHHE